MHIASIYRARTFLAPCITSRATFGGQRDIFVDESTEYATKPWAVSCPSRMSAVFHFRKQLHMTDLYNQTGFHHPTVLNTYPLYKILYLISRISALGFIFDLVVFSKLPFIVSEPAMGELFWMKDEADLRMMGH